MTTKSDVIRKQAVGQWYTGKCVLITGATGFMGKVLVEKMLRCLPGIKKIYVVIRTKRGVSPGKRMENMLKLPLFETLRSTPEGKMILTKLHPISGDIITGEDLGISIPNKMELIENVDIVFHAAATLKLEATLRDSVQHNLVGTKNLLTFCKQLKNLKAFVHLSTAFCHCDQEILDEKIYEPTRNPQQVIELCKWMDDETLNIVTPSLLGPHPNTYTFTKRLAETLVYEMGSELPVTIMRPSIVIPSLKDPIPGWVDSLNGPVGILVGAGKGVIRSMLCEAENHAEIIPVDIAVNSMILVAMERALEKFDEPPVYNVTQDDVIKITWGEVLERGRAALVENPFDWPLWYPDGNIRTNKISHNLIVFFFQLLPAYFIDFILFLTRQKRFMIRIQERIRLGMTLLQYFTLREWRFKTDKFKQLHKRLNNKEADIFFVHNIEFEVDEYLTNLILGTRKYCMKESLSTLPRARLYIRGLFIVDRFIKFIFVVSTVWYSMFFMKYLLVKSLYI